MLVIWAGIYSYTVGPPLVVTGLVQHGLLAVLPRTWRERPRRAVLAITSLGVPPLGLAALMASRQGWRVHQLEYWPALETLLQLGAPMAIALLAYALVAPID